MGNLTSLFKKRLFPLMPNYFQMTCQLKLISTQSTMPLFVTRLPFNNFTRTFSSINSRHEDKRESKEQKRGLISSITLVDFEQTLAFEILGRPAQTLRDKYTTLVEAKKRNLIKVDLDMEILDPDKSDLEKSSCVINGYKGQLKYTFDRARWHRSVILPSEQKEIDLFR